MADFDNAELTSVPTPEEDDALMFELAGLTIGWRASGLALERASDRGVEAGQLLDSVQTLFGAGIDPDDFEDLSEEELEEKAQEELEGDLADMLAVVADLIWLGALHFEAGIKRNAVLAILDPENVEGVPIDLMLSRIFPAIEEEVGDLGKEPKETSES